MSFFVSAKTCHLEVKALLWGYEPMYTEMNRYGQGKERACVTEDVTWSVC